MAPALKSESQQRITILGQRCWLFWYYLGQMVETVLTGKGWILFWRAKGGHRFDGQRSTPFWRPKVDTLWRPKVDTLLTATERTPLRRVTPWSARKISLGSKPIRPIVAFRTRVGRDFGWQPRSRIDQQSPAIRNTEGRHLRPFSATPESTVVQGEKFVSLG